MRKFLPPIAAVALLGAGGLAFSQTPPSGQPAGAPLSEADRSADPFPPGRHAALVKQVCVDCHGAKVITDKRFTKEEAEGFYRNMVSSNLDTEQARNIIEYLTTTLGQ